MFHYVLIIIKEIEESSNVEHEFPRTASNDDRELRSQSIGSDDNEHVVNVEYGIETGNEAVEHENHVVDIENNEGDSLPSEYVRRDVIMNNSIYIRM